MTDNKLILEHFFPYQLTNLAQRVSSNLAKTYQQKFDLTIAEWRVLACLGEQGGATAKMIADQSFMDKVKTSRAIKELSQRGLIKKIQDTSDSRAFWLSLNRKGTALYDELVPYAKAWEKELLNSLTKSEYNNLIQVLTKLNCQLDSMN